jgi:hypothetical protein
MPTAAYSEAVSLLERFRSDSRIQSELNATLHNSGEEKTDYKSWLNGCERFLDDNHDVLKEWM